MLIILLYFMLVITTCWGQISGNLKDASCVKNREHIYVLGGQVLNDNGNPSKHVYKAELKQLQSSNSDNSDLWSQQSIEGYETLPYLTSASVPFRAEIFYFGGKFSKGDEVNLRKIDLENQRIEKIQSKPTYLLKHIFDKLETFDISMQAPLLVNDRNPNELVLIVGKIIGRGRKSFVDNYIYVFDVEANNWSTHRSGCLTGKRMISAIYNNILIVFGPGVNTDKIMDHHVVPYYEKKTTLLLAEYEIGSDKWYTRISSGDVPPSGIEYTFTQEDHMLYLVGENDGTNGKIYALNLKTKTWTAFNESNFHGYELGCLTYHDNKLIHYFGVDNNQGIQSIDISQWSSENQPNKLNSNSINSIENNHSTEIIVGSICGAIALIIIIIAVIYLIRRRRNVIKPPKLLDNFVSSESLLNPLKNQTWSIKSGTSILQSNSDLFEITELKPEECFKPDLPIFSTLDSKAMEKL